MLKEIYCNMSRSTLVMPVTAICFFFAFRFTSNVFSDVELGWSICYVATHSIYRDVRTRTGKQTLVDWFLRTQTRTDAKSMDVDAKMSASAHLCGRST